MRNHLILLVVSLQMGGGRTHADGREATGWLETTALGNQHFQATQGSTGGDPNKRRCRGEKRLLILGYSTYKVTLSQAEKGLGVKPRGEFPTPKSGPACGGRSARAPRGFEFRDVPNGRDAKCADAEH